MQFAEFRRRDHACRPVLLVAGEIDLAVRDELLAALHQLVVDAHSPAYLDMSLVTFFDSTGVNALIDASRFARDHDVELIITPSSYVTTTLQVLGLTEQFHWGTPPAVPESPE